MLIVLGDFNDNGCGVLGPFGSGSPSDNTDRMTTYSGMHDLTVLGSWFRRLDVRRWTWYSNDGFIKNEIDHILTRHRDRGLIKSYRTFRSTESAANCDHVLLYFFIYLNIGGKGRKPLICR